MNIQKKFEMEESHQIQQKAFTGQQLVDPKDRQQGLRKKKLMQQKALQMGISKSKLKKIQQKQKWEQTRIQKRKEKRQKEKQRKKQSKKQISQTISQQMQNDPRQKLLSQPNQEQQNSIKSKQNPKQSKQNQNQDPKEYPLTRRRKDEYQEKMLDNLKVVIDLQFYDQMCQKELNSLVKQLSYCHSINRKMQKTFNYVLTSASESRIKLIDERYNGTKWGITFIDQHVDQAFKLQQLVYLTGDAEDQIEQFDTNKIYIIGGIVDHNRLKKITYNFAKENKIQVKRLPFKNIKLKSNVHLAVNHVWEWMLRRYNNQTWDQSLEKVLPERKVEKVTQL